MKKSVLFVFAALLCAACHQNPSSSTPESSVILFRDAQGRVLTAEDLRGATGTVQYEISGNWQVSPEANALHQQARQAGAHGDYKRALKLFHQSAMLAPTWPFPVYDAAYTYLLMKQDDDAHEYYRQTVVLAPRGFFTAISALDTLEKEHAGALPRGTYAAYVALESVDTPGEKEALVRKLVEVVPRFAPAWKELQSIETDDAKRLADIDKGLALDPDADTKGVLLLNKALILNATGDHHGAVQLLGQLILDPRSTLATVERSKFALSMMIKNKTAGEN